MTKETQQAQGPYDFGSLRFRELIFCYGGAMYKRDDRLARAAMDEIDRRLDAARIAGFDLLDLDR